MQGKRKGGENGTIQHKTIIHEKTNNTKNKRKSETNQIPKESVMNNEMHLHNVIYGFLLSVN